MAEEIILYGQKYELAPLDPDELKIFDEEFQMLLNVNGSVERLILTEMKDTIRECLQAIKFALGKPTFKGLTPGDTELGWTFIRPGHVKTADTPRTDWEISLTAGYQDWLYGPAGQPFLMAEEAGLIWLYSKSYAAEPAASELKVKTGRVELVPFDIRSMWLRDNANRVYVYPHPIILVMPKTELYARLCADWAKTDVIAPGGFTVGLGRYLKKETY